MQLLPRWTTIRSALLLGIGIAASAAAADTTNGALSYKGRTAALKFAWLVTGPDDMAPGKTVRRLILSATDIGAKIEACKTFSCTDSDLKEGMTVEFGSGPRLNYWVVLNGQLIQYSGTAKHETFTARANEAGRVAGKLAIDDVAAGGPKIDAEFDVKLMKEFKVAR